MDGKPEGLHRLWYENGQLKKRKEIEWYNYKEWDRYGNLIDVHEIAKTYDEIGKVGPKYQSWNPLYRSK